MNALPNRRDDEVRRLLDAPHPVVPVDLAARAALRGRRIVRRRRIEHTVVWTVLLAAALAALVLAALAYPNHPAQPDTSWWSN